MRPKTPSFGQAARQLSRADPDERTREHVRWIVDPGVYAGLPDQRRHGPQRRREHGQHVAGGGHSQPGGGKPSILSPEVIEAVRDLRSAGKSPRAIADRLNAYGQRSLRGGRWHRTSVRRLLDRLDAEATAA